LSEITLKPADVFASFFAFHESYRLVFGPGSPPVSLQKAFMRLSISGGKFRLDVDIHIIPIRRDSMTDIAKNTICLWYDDSAEEAAETQEETDRYWNAIVGNGGQESECGWCKDKWGISWQITPVALTRAYTSPDRAAAKRAFEAMMTMKKIDIAAIEAAFRG
jgi:hypothetical protein